MTEEHDYLKFIPVSEVVYRQLQQLWQYELNYHKYPQINETEETIALCHHLKLVEAANWISENESEYQYGRYYQQWQLDIPFGDLHCKNIDGIGQNALTNVPRLVAHHSPDGHNWGYGGSGPSDLALDILNHLIPPNRKNGRTECWCGVSSIIAWNLHNKFKTELLCDLPLLGGIIKRQTIERWVQEQLTNFS